MSALYRALSVELDEDLLPFSLLLRQRGVVHRIAEEGGRQVLDVENTVHVAEVKALYKRWRSGEFQLEITRPRRQALSFDATLPWLQAPITLLLILLSLAGFLLVYAVGSSTLVGYFTFNTLEMRNGQMVLGDMGGQYWRLVTPIFLHFGWLHIVFNALWLWELGKRVEAVIGHFNLLMLCLVIAVVSNVSQSVYGGGALFGGMSGVVYGLLGFAWVAPLLQPRWPIQPQPVIMLFMVGWLVACMAGVVEALGFGSIANAAHLGGLISGAVLGALFGGLSRSASDKP
ncbi:MAG: rhomboid family intramembrane serine protease [Halioglobus sp.]|nr:rhomboid family intramembrane serine protease [Halioglobus sp.]